MDEVGRGTSVRDGLAIAFAVVRHLYFKNNCRALFATHFHELSDLLGCTLDYRGGGLFERIGFFCTDVQETEVKHLSKRIKKNAIDTLSRVVLSRTRIVCGQV